MTNAQMLDVMRQTFFLAVRIALPFLLVSMVIGIVVAIFQAVTQINEQTVMFVLKLIGIVAMIFILGSTILVTLQDFFKSILTMIAGG
ncbi:MAG: flagellar biosynthetic protein FliQ [Lachnospiraceae bacterium]|jgi:flagellar biosynthetic protein FliQ|nr:flagellar biosynthetic protein FliQ [Lachnospiraceae bacterium]